MELLSQAAVKYARLLSTALQPHYEQQRVPLRTKALFYEMYENGSFAHTSMPGAENLSILIAPNGPRSSWAYVYSKDVAVGWTRVRERIKIRKLSPKT